MKKILITFTFLFISIFSISSVNALSSYEESKIQIFYDEKYDGNYPNCVYISHDSGYMICLKSSDLSNFSGKYTENRSAYQFYDVTLEVQYTVFKSSKIDSSNIRKLSFVNAYILFIPSELSSNFDFYVYDENDNKTLITSNFQFKKLSTLIFDLPDDYSVVLKDKDNKVVEQSTKNKYIIYFGDYTYSIYLDDKPIIEDESIVFSYENTLKPIKKVSFDIPKDSDFTLKDMNGNIIISNNGYYYLPSGNYIYFLSKPGYFSKENETITIDDDANISLSLDSKYNPNNMQSIFTQYYNYIKDLVSDVFPLENPLFIYLISITIGFFLIAIIRKLIGGIV